MNPATALVSAILTEAEKHGGQGLTITQLMKFLYLADYYEAQESNGKPFTGFHWYFHHYGPYSTDAVSIIDALVKDALVSQQTIEREDRDFAALQWRRPMDATTLDKMTLSFHTRALLARDIREYRFDLKGLLNHVYFHTSPMEDAVPGDELSFASCRMTQVRDVKPIFLTAPSAKAKARARELVAKFEARAREARVPARMAPAIYDRHYFEALETKADNDNSSQQITAFLTFERKR